MTPGHNSGFGHSRDSIAESDGANLAQTPLSKDEALSGDMVYVYCGPYVGQRGSIQWINSNGTFSVYLMDKVTGSDGEIVENVVIWMYPYDLRIELPPNTLMFSKQKGYNVAVGDTVEVARGPWCFCQGVVKAVDLSKTSLDIVCSVDGIHVSILFQPLTSLAHRFA